MTAPHVCHVEGGPPLTEARFYRMLLALLDDGDLDGNAAVVGVEIGTCWRCWLLVAYAATSAAGSAISSRAELTGDDPRPALELHLSAALAQLEGEV